MPDQFGSVWSTCSYKWSSSKVIHGKNQYPIVGGHVASSAIEKFCEEERLVGSWKAPCRLAFWDVSNPPCSSSNGFSGTVLHTSASVALLHPQYSPKEVFCYYCQFVHEEAEAQGSVTKTMSGRVRIWVQDLSYQIVSLITISQGSSC